jgi:Mg-chelatase subunit ChlD
MTWAAKRQVTYFIVFMIIMVVVVGIPLFALWYEAPTCFDGKQNGGEQGQDCGGICERLCPALEIKPVVQWQQVFELEPGLYSAVAYVQNPNLNAHARNTPYAFTFRDATNAIIGKREGTVYVPPGKNFAVFESNIILPKDAGQIRTSFEFTSEPDWHRVGSTTPVTVSSHQVDNLSDKPTITADLINSSLTDMGRVDATVIVYDTEGNAVGASKTYVDSILKQSKTRVVFTWPMPFTSQVTTCQQPTDVMLTIDRSGSMASESKNPVEPLTSAKSAALTFVDNLKPQDKAGLISFATTATFPIDQLLTIDRPAMKEAIEAIAIDSDGTQYTNMKDAIEKSIDELTSNRHNPQAKRALVILTDGNPTYPEKKGDTHYPFDVALAAARDAQSRGIEVFTIGLGNDIDEDFLKSVAGFTERYYRAPTKEDLESVYARIGAALCKAGPARVEIIPEITPR